jgi:hypothetical protein
MDAKVNSKTYYKICFSIFSRFVSFWLKSLQKVLNVFSKYFLYGYQKQRILCRYIICCEKVTKKVYAKEVRGLKSFVRSTKM